MFRSQKSPSAGIMRFWKTKSQSADRTFEKIAKKHPPEFIPGYLRLEQRTLLSATFTTVGTTGLVLNDFDAGQDLDFSQANTVVNGISQDSFVFQVASGSFTGNTANPLIELESVNGGINNQLEVATTFFQGSAANADLNFNGLSTAGTAVEFTQSSSNLTFDSLQLSNFANDNRDLDLMATGDVTLNNVTVFDSDPTDAVAAPATLDVSVVGSLSLTGQTGNLISNPNANVDLSASGNITMASSAELTSQQTIELSSTTGSVVLSDVSAGADVQVQAANNITQRFGSEVDAGTTANFVANNGSVNLANLTAGTDVQVQAFNNIVQQSGSDVTAGTTVNLLAENGTVNLGNVSAGDDIVVQAENTLNQQSTTQVVAGSTVDFVSNNGSVNLADVTASTDIQVRAFNNIAQQSGSDVVAGATVNLAAENGFANLGNVSAGNDLQVQAASDITQQTGTEVGASATVNLVTSNGAVTLTDVSANDNIQVQAENNITQLAGTEVNAGATVDFIANNGTVDLTNVSAGGDVLVQAADDITQQSTTAVDAGSNVNFVSSNGSINLTDVSANDNIQVQAENNITQLAGTEVNAGATVDFVSSSGSIDLTDISANDNIQVQAANDIAQLTGTEVDAGTTVNFITNNGSVNLADITAGTDVQVQAFNNITQQAGTEVDAGGTVNFVAGNGTVDLTDVSAGNDVLVQAEGDITQQTTTEVVAGSNVNFVSNNGAVVLTDVSADDNIQVQAQNDITQLAGTEASAGVEVNFASNNGSVTLADISAGANIEVQAANNIAQLTGTEIDAGTTANFIADNGTVDLTNVSAGDSVLIQAADDITQQSTTAVNAGSTINFISSDGSINLTDISGNNIRVQAADSITQLAGTEVDADGAVSFIANNGAVTLANVSTGDDLQIQATNDITQLANSEIVVGTSATVSSTSGDILLATTSAQTITVVDQANFTANQIEIGLDGEPAGSVTATNVLLGSVSLNASTAVLVEDDSTTLAGNSDVDNLFVSSSQDINNVASASLVSNNAQLNATNNIVLGNQLGDSVLLDEVSLIAENVHLEVGGDLEINGVQPTVANTQPIATGTQIDQSLFVIADGSVEQTQGDLHAQAIGIEATEYVHLTSVAAVNDAIAITAGGSQLLTAPTLIATLDSLAAVENGEVDADRPQAIALAHRGDVNVTNVTSITGSDSLAGFNSTDGSVSIFADQAISLQQDVTAFSPVADPQVTLYSAIGDATNPSIFFDGGEASVTGPTNIGVVNSNQAFANFLDTDGFLFEETTQLLTLNTDGTVSQDIVIEYGQLGEVGFRVGIVFDALNQPLNPIEDLNLFTPSNTVDSEAFEDTLFQQNTVVRGLIGGNEGGRETFSQIDDFTAQAVITHFDNPNVFTDIIVRNDQDINLFSGSLETVDNSLNETTQRIRSVFDLPRGAAPILPAINPINSIEVRPTFDLPFDSPPPIDQTSSIFSRQIAPFEEGELRWVQVEIPVDELELVGDEISLRQPSKLYPAAEDASEQDFENVGENETDRIIGQIERSPIAEPGYWYRIFKAYDYRGDELFFYHYKTGEVDDAVSELDAGDESPSDNESLRDNESLDDEESDRQAPIFDDQTSLNDNPNYPTTDSETTTASNSVADNELLIGLLRRESGPTATTTEPLPAADLPTVDQTIFTESFDHLSRLKRKLKRCL